MNRPFTPPRLLLAMILGLSLLTGCDRKDPASLVAEARTLLAAGDERGAMIQLKNALEQDGQNADARYELGRLYFSQLDLAGAEKELRRARDAGYVTSVIDPMLARILISQRDYQRLLDELPAPTGGGADAATLVALRATAQLGLGQKEAARQAMQEALQAAPGNPEVHLALAKLALIDDDPDRALDEIDQGLKTDPAHLDSQLLKGDILQATGKPAEAAAIYRSILQAHPHHTPAQLALAGISIAENRLADARNELAAARKRAPDNLQARYFEALVDFRESKTERARDGLAAILKAAPGFVPALLLAGSVEFTLGNVQTAETHLSKVVTAAPGNPYARRLLAATQLRSGRPDEAARTLAPLDPENTGDAAVNLIAGEIALAKKDWSRASAHFEKAAQAHPANATIRTELGVARMALGDTRGMDDLLTASALEKAQGGGRAQALIILNQLRNSEYDAALASADQLEKQFPASPVPWNYRGAAYLGKQDTEKARASFERALSLDPTFFPAAGALAQLDLQDKKPAAARARFESVLKADPKHLQALLALADLSRAARDDKAYLDLLEQAVAAHPQSLQPRARQTRYWLSKGDSAQAIAAAQAAVAAKPGDPAALDLLGNAQLTSRDFDSAIATYRKLADRMPDQAESHVRLARAQLAAGRSNNEVRATLREALRRKPDHIEALLLLGNLEKQSARHDAALEIARRIQQQHPHAVAGPALEGDVELARKRYPAALQAYERAHALAPSAATLIGQYQALAGSERVDEGMKRLGDWLTRHPADRRARFFLAEQLMAHQRYQPAAEQYLVLNEQAPEDVVVLNNLASALSELKDPRAQTFAEQALKRAPGNPAVMDTAGWILVQQGQVGQGTRLLQQAHAKAPEAGDIHYRYAAALALGGDKARARQELERLLKGGRDFRLKPAASALMQTLEKPDR